MSGIGIVEWVQSSSFKIQFLGVPPEQNIKIDIPTKTQLYLDQAERENQHAVEMYRIFQRDLLRLQLIAGEFAK